MTPAARAIIDAWLFGLCFVGLVVLVVVVVWGAIKEMRGEDSPPGHQPTKGHLDASDPPRGGSGVPRKLTPLTPDPPYTIKKTYIDFHASIKEEKE